MRLRHPAPTSPAIYNAIALCLLGLYAIFCICTYELVVEPSLRGATDWRLYTDSTVFMDAAQSVQQAALVSGFAGLLHLTANYLVPTALALVLKTPGLIALFNAALFFLSCFSLWRTFPDFKWYIFLPIILLSPSGYVSLLSLNKEIFVLFCAVRLAIWFFRPSFWNMALLITFSLVLRWEQALVLLIFLAFQKLDWSPKKAATVLIIGISLLYPFAMQFVHATEGLDDSSSSLFYQKLNALQDYGLFFALLVPKLFIALTSQLLRFWEPFLDVRRLHDLPTGVFVIVDQLWMCIVAGWMWRKRLWSPRNGLIYFAMVYTIIILAAPMNSPRYLYLIYVLLVILLSCEDLQRVKIRSSGTVIVSRPNLLTPVSG